MTHLLECFRTALLAHCTHDPLLSDLDGWTVRAAPAAAVRAVQHVAAEIGVDRTAAAALATRATTAASAAAVLAAVTAATTNNIKKKHQGSSKQQTADTACR
jgi:hypothetical protein